MGEAPEERVTQALERLHEDERLTADLDDAAAEAVYQWLERELAASAALDRQALDARVGTLRRAVLAAARLYNGDPQALIAAVTALVTAPAAPTPPHGDSSPLRRRRPISRGPAARRRGRRATRRRV